MKQDTFELGGGAFQSGGMIPSKYTCDGENISPSLAWHGAPPGTKYFALIVDDPDAPSKTWVHWVLYDIPAALNNLPEAADQHAIGARGGRNDFGKTTYGGPCPPSGSHHYHFKLYALDAAIGGELDKEGLLKAMQGHVLATTELIGLYARRQ